MNKDEIYNFFKLDARLFMSLTAWLHETVKDTIYQKIPYKVISYSAIDNDCIGLKILFLKDNEEKLEYYRVKIDDLKEY